MKKKKKTNQKTEQPNSALRDAQENNSWNSTSYSHFLAIIHTIWTVIDNRGGETANDQVYGW